MAASFRLEGGRAGRRLANTHRRECGRGRADCITDRSAKETDRLLPNSPMPEAGRRGANTTAEGRGRRVLLAAGKVIAISLITITSEHLVSRG